MNVCPVMGLWGKHPSVHYRYHSILKPVWMYDEGESPTFAGSFKIKYDTSGPAGKARAAFRVCSMGAFKNEGMLQSYKPVNPVTNDSFIHSHTQILWLYAQRAILGNTAKSLNLVRVGIYGLSQAVSCPCTVKGKAKSAASSWKWDKGKSQVSVTSCRIAFCLLFISPALPLSLSAPTHPPTSQTDQRFALYLYIREGFPRCHTLIETKARGPFGAAFMSLALISSKCICDLLPCPHIPLLFPIVHCLLGTVPAKVFFPYLFAPFSPGTLLCMSNWPVMLLLFDILHSLKTSHLHVL